MLALQASGAYWDKDYYSPERKTITKPLMMLSKRQLRAELLMLIYIAINTNRALIIPNVLIGMGRNILGGISLADCLRYQYLYIPPAGTPHQRKGVDGLPYCVELWKQGQHGDSAGLNDAQVLGNYSHAAFNRY